MKYKSFKEIPKFTRPGSYATDCPILRLDKWVREMEEDMGLNLCPDFQRGHVWTKAQQERYIEFLLRDGRTGRDIYFNCPSWHTQISEGAYNEFVCVDGLQRITAIRRFTADEIKAFGSFFSEYEDNKRNALNTVRLHVNDLKTEREVLTWYIEMNTGGTPHSAKEIARVIQMRDGLGD